MLPIKKIVYHYVINILKYDNGRELSDYINILNYVWILMLVIEENKSLLAHLVGTYLVNYQGSNHRSQTIEKIE